MKNIAILELDVLSVKLTIAAVVKGNSVITLHQATEKTNE